MPNEITCPGCGYQFEPNEAIREEVQKELRVQMQVWRTKKEEEFALQIEKEKQLTRNAVEQSLRQSIAAEYENQLRHLTSTNAHNEETLKLLRQKEADYLKKEYNLKLKEAELDLELQKKLQEQRQQLTDQIRKQEAEKTALKENEYSMRLKELEVQLEAQRKLADEMKRKAEQGSMQLQGEVQELALEELLRDTFRFDAVEEVGKGVKGADCLLTIRNKAGQESGKIIFESKRTENFSTDWIEKLKNDRLKLGADIAVIVTRAMPKDMDQFGEKQGVYICTFNEVKSLVSVLRNALIKISETRRSQENKGDKMVALYNYLTGTEFGGNWNAMRENFRQLRSLLAKEREDFEKNWKKKEKQIELIIQNSLYISGSIEGIAGSDSINLQLQYGDDGEAGN